MLISSGSCASKSYSAKAILGADFGGLVCVLSCGAGDGTEIGPALAAREAGEEEGLGGLSTTFRPLGFPGGFFGNVGGALFLAGDGDGFGGFGGIAGGCVELEETPPVVLGDKVGFGGNNGIGGGFA